jgi:hypothetical protein
MKRLTPKRISILLQALDIDYAVQALYPVDDLSYGQTVKEYVERNGHTPKEAELAVKALVEHLIELEND